MERRRYHHRHPYAQTNGIHYATLIYEHKYTPRIKSSHPTKVLISKIYKNKLTTI